MHIKSVFSFILVTFLFKFPYSIFSLKNIFTWKSEIERNFLSAGSFPKHPQQRDLEQTDARSEEFNSSLPWRVRYSSTQAITFWLPECTF